MTTGGDLAQYRFLVIAGASKAGTTSVFNYLAKHPEICASDTKETRFFLDSDYPLRSMSRCDKDGAALYLGNFGPGRIKTENAWKLEATPDYLYSPGTPRRLHETLPNLRLVFILREPIARLMSFYRFGQQMNEVPQNMSFDQYVDAQRSGAYRAKVAHPAFLALGHGRYSEFLKPFNKLFDRSQIYISFTEDLRKDTNAFMAALCRWAGVDEEYFTDHTYEVRNKSIHARNPRLHRSFYETKRFLRSAARRSAYLQTLLRPLGGKVDALYRSINVAEHGPIEMSSATEKFITSYYSAERAALEEMFSIEVPWRKSARLSPNTL